MSSKPLSKAVCRATGVALALVLATATQAVTFQIINVDDPGVGLTDPTPVAPVGGNAGTTLGEQRQNVLAKVAEIWGQNLRSDVPIRVLAAFGALPCNTATGALAGALAWNQLAGFPNAAKPGTWYPAALANKLAGVALVEDPDPTVSADILTIINANVGNDDCIAGGSFYLGLDNNAPQGQFNLLTVMLHEFGHGLGFATLTDSATGQQEVAVGGAAEGLPAIWDHYLLDPKQGKVWAAMTNEERVASAITPRNLVWNGRNVTRNAPRVLDRGVPELYVTGQGLNRFLMIGEAQFGPIIDRRMLIAQPMAPVVDQADGRGLACTPLDAGNAAAVRGKVAVIDRGDCAFVDKVRNAQEAGAKAVVIADNAPGTPPQPMGAPDDSITIPSVRVTQDDGSAIKAAIAAGQAPFNVPYAVMFQNQLRLAGADYGNRVFMFTPNPRQQGSSVNHYDTSARRNLLMEPALNADLSLLVRTPEDLTLELFRDIGW